jgi:hypothetical protein
MNQQELGVILATLRELPTAAQIRELKEETATLRTSIFEREAQLGSGRAVSDTDLYEISSLRQEMAQLRNELHAERSRWSQSPPTSNGTAPYPHVRNDNSGSESNNHVSRDPRVRTPRRMGQPLRPSGSSHN